jgi:hypothetical protein
MKKENMSGDAKHKELEDQMEEMSAWKNKVTMTTQTQSHHDNTDCKHTGNTKSPW